MTAPAAPDLTRITKALCQMMGFVLPRPVKKFGTIADWEVVAPALLGHATFTTRTIIDLQPPLHLQAQILARAMMEHAILFAWLAASPAERIPIWWADSAARRSITVEKRAALARRPLYAGDAEVVAMLTEPDWSAADDAREQEILAEGRRVRAARRARELPPFPPLEQQAEQADAHWLAKLEAQRLVITRPFAVSYRTIYDRGHDATHARSGVIAALLAQDDSGNVAAGLPPREPHPAELPYDAVSGVYLDLLLVASLALGYPRLSQIGTVLGSNGRKFEV